MALTDEQFLTDIIYIYKFISETERHFNLTEALINQKYLANMALPLLNV
jgi:hypothetical protein